MMKKIRKYLFMTILTTVLLAGIPAEALAAEPPYDQVVSYSKAIPAEEVTQYGMLPIYGRDVKNGTYDVEVRSSSTMFRVVKAKLTVDGNKMTADITLSGQGYIKLFMGTGKEAAASDMSDFIDYTEGDDGLYTFTVPVDGLDKALKCAAFSQRKQQWYDRLILFDASSLPEKALKVDLPDYDAIESAMRGGTGGVLITSSGVSGGGDDEDGSQSQDAANQSGTAKAMNIDIDDGEYSIDVILAGGSGKASVSTPTLLIVKDGKAYARLVWSSSNYDYMLVGSEKFLNLNEDGGSSTFEIPITAMDKEMKVIANTTAMGDPHEVNYTLTFYKESIGSKRQMPQEAAKRVLVIAVIIIIIGGVLNHYVKKKRRA